MKTRVLVTTVVSFLLLVAVIAAGINAVFTVTLVRTNFSVFSAEGEREAAQLKEQMDGFVGKSTTFLNLDEMRAVADAYPCMRIDSIEKKYPSTVEVTVSERRESFAVMNGQGYAILADDGVYLYDREDPSSRSGGNAILLEDFGLELKAGEMPEAENFKALLSVFSVFEETLGSAASSILSVKYEPSLVQDAFMIRMREGISIEIVGLGEMVEEKARAALSDERDGYLVRTDLERLSGCITVAYTPEDGVQVDYKFAYEFAA